MRMRNNSMSVLVKYDDENILGFINGVAIALKKIRPSKGYYWNKQLFCSIVSLFKMGTSLKGKN